MTAAAELAALAVPDAGVPRCSALVPVTAMAEDGNGAEFLGVVQCRLPGVAWVEGRCRCGHQRDGWLCESCLRFAGQGGCRACLELEQGAHDCPLSTTITGGAS